jgi:hypothetical protein
MSKTIESVCNNILESTHYKWNKVPIKLNHEMYIKIIDKLSVLTEYDKISYSIYPPNDTDIYIMQYSIIQGIKRWWYSDNRWKTFEMIELLMFNAVLYDSRDFKCYDKTIQVCLNLKKPYETCDEFCKKYDELSSFISQHYLKLIEFQTENNPSENNPSENNSTENNNLQFFLDSSKKSTVDTFDSDAIQPRNESSNKSSSNKTNVNTLYSSCPKHNTVIGKIIHDVGNVSPPSVSGSKTDAKIHIEMDVAKHPSNLSSDIKQTHSKNNTSHSNDKSEHIDNSQEQLKKSKYILRTQKHRKKRRRYLLFW